MKKYILIISVIIFIGSCITDPPETKTYHTIINNSTHNIKLQMFFEGVETGLLTLNKNEKEVFEYNYRGGAKSPPAFGGDSMLVIYNDTISIMHYKWDYEGENVKRSIFLESSYTGKQESVYVFRYEYEFTEADYQEALDLQ